MPSGHYERHGRTKHPKPEPPNPSGICMCGCGEPAPISTCTSAKNGLVQGHPARYIRGHAQRLRGGRGADFLGPEYIIDDNGCWVWMHGRWIGGKYGQTKDKRYAHRVYYENKFGPIPEELVIDHLCQNQLCVNPDHLEPVTKSENSSRGGKARYGKLSPTFPTKTSD